jgi:hypothetical protein
MMLDMKWKKNTGDLFGSTMAVYLPVGHPPFLFVPFVAS